MYKIFNIPNDAADFYEQLGTKRKFWFKDKDNETKLFKEGRPSTGENWAEIIIAGIASLINIPHAEYDFATWRGFNGVITPSFVPKDGRLVLGNELLAKLVQGYDEKKLYHQKQYVLKRVFAILDNDFVEMPIDWQPINGISSAVEVFVGYLMLDTLVANQDRHHENWGLIATKEKRLHLTPIYDNASSLGRVDSDAIREEILTTADMRRHITAYVTRANSAFYQNPNSPKVMSSFETFKEAERMYPLATNVWLEQLERLDLKAIEEFFHQIPNDYITPIATKFALEMIRLNRNRLLQLT
jgi:hypothetical protein